MIPSPHNNITEVYLGLKPGLTLTQFYDDKSIPFDKAKLIICEKFTLTIMLDYFQGSLQRFSVENQFNCMYQLHIFSSKS